MELHVPALCVWDLMLTECHVWDPMLLRFVLDFMLTLCYVWDLMFVRCLENLMLTACYVLLCCMGLASHVNSAWRSYVPALGAWDFLLIMCHVWGISSSCVVCGFSC